MLRAEHARRAQAHCTFSMAAGFFHVFQSYMADLAVQKKIVDSPISIYDKIFTHAVNPVFKKWLCFSLLKFCN